MTDQADEFDRHAVVTIQGGGVYGLGLLGQLSALIDRHKIMPIALAGTSAGAIIATLFWAGLTPKEIRDRFLEMSVVELEGSKRDLRKPKNKENLTDLLGPFEPAHNPYVFIHFKKLARNIEAVLHSLAKIESHPTPSATWRDNPGRFIRLGIGWPLRKIRQVFQFLWYAVSGILLALSCLIKICRHAKHRGLFPGDRLEQVIDSWIRSSPKLADYGDALGTGGLLTFGQINDLRKKYPDDLNCYFMPLILTATNITTKKLVLIHSFDESFSDVPIARAVRASAGFPFFFRPVTISCGLEAGWFVDGGVVSNFPAWVFSSDLRRRLGLIPEFADLARRPWLSIGLRSIDGPRNQPMNISGVREFVKSMLSLFTNQVRNELENALTSRVPRSINLEQPDSEASGPRNLLDIDKLTEDKIRLMFHRGDEFADSRLEQVSFKLPAGPERKKIEEALADLAIRTTRIFGLTAVNDARLRSNVFVPQGEELRLKYAFNMNDCKDKNISFSYDSGLTGRCYETRNCWVCNLEVLRQEVESRPEKVWFRMLPEQHLKVEPDRTWLASVPIFDPYESWPRRPKRRDRPARSKEFFLAWDWESDTDGAVLGVLNVDASFSYELMGIPEDASLSLTDPRIQATLIMAQATSREIGLILSDSFARGG